MLSAGRGKTSAIQSAIYQPQYSSYDHPPIYLQRPEAATLLHGKCTAPATAHQTPVKQSASSTVFPGARFSKDPITYRAHKAIFNDLYLNKKAVYGH